MRTIMSKIAFAPLALCMALTVCCLTLFGMTTAATAQVTFSVEGKGQGTIRIDLSLNAAAGVDRGELLTMGRLVQRDLHSSGFFSLAILPRLATINRYQRLSRCRDRRVHRCRGPDYRR
jgi:hypothetical protein